MTNHLTDEQLIGYIHHTLTDAEREAIDRHLAECPTCRAHLAGNETLQRRIRNEFSADLRSSRSSSQMSFAAIAPRVKRSRRLTMFVKHSNQVLYGAATLVVLVALGIGLVILFNNFSQPAPAPQEEVIQLTAALPEVIEQPDTVPAEVGNLPLIDPAIGEYKWQFDVGGGIWSSPTVAEGVVYFGSNDHHLYAVDIETGQERWKFETEGMIYSNPTVADGLVYVGSIDHHLYAIDSQTGREMWKFETGGPVVSSPTIANGIVYFGSGCSVFICIGLSDSDKDRHLYALDSQTGRELWKFETGGGVKAAILNNVVYFGSGDKNFYALDSQTGQEHWRFETGGPIISIPAIADGIIYFGSNDGHLYALDSQTGQQKWKSEALISILEVYSPFVSDGLVYIGGKGTRLYALTAETGQVQWQFDNGDMIQISSLFSDGVVYIGSSDGLFYAVDGQTGQELWRFETEGPAGASTPTIAAGVLYFKAGRSFYALKLKDAD